MTKMRIKDFYPGWIAEHICEYCLTNFDGNDCPGCEVAHLIESDEVEKE